MTSLDHRNDARQEDAAAPGDVHRWRAFSLLAVAFLMTIVDLLVRRTELARAVAASLPREAPVPAPAD